MVMEGALGMQLVGVDGCRTGWALARGDDNTPGAIDFTIAHDLDALFEEAAAGGTSIVIDMPIGLPDSSPRGCDHAARAILGGRRASSVFPTPCRSSLAAGSYSEACMLSRAASGKAMTRQTYGILSKIREIDAAITPALQDRMHEGHPELVFALLAGGAGLASSKRTPCGERQRLDLLAAYWQRFAYTGRQGGCSGDAITAARSRLGAANVARNDLVDAAACLVAAHRIATGTALVLPLIANAVNAQQAPRDGRGLRMEIVG